MMMASATDPAKPVSLCSGCDDQTQDEDADHDRGDALEEVERRMRSVPARRDRGRADSVMWVAMRTPIGTAITAESATMMADPMMAEQMPTPGPPTPAGPG